MVVVVVVVVVVVIVVVVVVVVVIGVVAVVEVLVVVLVVPVFEETIPSNPQISFLIRTGITMCLFLAYCNFVDRVVHAPTHP